MRYKSSALATTSDNVSLVRKRINLQALPQKSYHVNPGLLTEQVVTRVPPRQDVFRGRWGRALDLDTIEASLKQADIGNMRMLTDLSRETIDTDPHLAAVLNKRFGAISSLPWEVIPAEGMGIDIEKARFYADVVRNQLNSLADFGQRVHQLSWALFDGRAALENLWIRADEMPRLPRLVHEKFGKVNWMIRDIAWIHPRRIHFGPERELRVYDRMIAAGFSEHGLSLRDEPGKFIYWTPQLFGEYPEREGLARRVLYWSFFKRFSARERMILMELFGKPWRWLEVDEESSADVDDLKSADELLQNVGGSTSFRFPRGTRFQVAQPGKGAGEVHQQAIEESDKQISKLVLGQTGTTDAQPSGMNNIQANVMQAEQFMILMRDAHMISDVFETHLTDQIIALNFGPSEVMHAPRFRLRADMPLDRNKELERLKLAIDTGLEIPLNEAYEISGFRLPKPDEAIIKIETPPAHPFAVQPPVERPVVVYPAGTELPERVLQPIAPAGEGGLESPTDRPPDQPAGGLIDEGKANRLREQIEERAAGMNSLATAHPSDLILAKTILSSVVHPSGCVCGSCRVILSAGEDEQVLQPEEAVIGSLETLIAKGTKEGARQLEEISKRYAEAVEGLTEPIEIIKALTQVYEDMDLFQFTRGLERKILHGAMGGALASAYELETNETLEVAKFTRTKLATFTEDAPRDPNFVERPLLDAVRWFKAQQVVTRQVFNRLEASAKRRAFTIAGMTNELMLQEAKSVLEQVIRSGGKLTDFRKTVSEKFESAGFTPKNPSHVETIYRTNVLNAYNSGRYAQATQPAVLRLRPYWQIRTVNDGPPRQRATHQAVHLWVIRADDSIWKTIYPPFGFNCRCRVVSLSEVEFKQRQLTLRTGLDVRGLPDPGFTSGVSSLL
jgi:phage gp29-like protein